MLKYLAKEENHKAILCPFMSNPFNYNLKFSPLNSVPKKEVGERRVILDLSFSKDAGVNAFIDKDLYLWETVELKFPRIDDICNLIKVKVQVVTCLKRTLDGLTDKLAFVRVTIV